MPNYEKDIQYMRIIKNILENDKFMELEHIKHHNINRLEHSIKVSYNSYKIAKIFGLSKEEVARAGLLHDFYLGQVNEQNTLKDKILLFTDKHPREAVENSLKYFDLTDKEEDIIRAHMFPVDIKIPRYAESWLVSFVDKYISIKEFKYKFQEKITMAKGYLYILVILSFF